jgi:The GLUG motif
MLWHVAGTVRGGNNAKDLGGLLGRSFFITLSYCSAAGNVSGRDNALGLGGLAGRMRWGEIQYCYATGDVSGSDALGGLLGGEIYPSSITSSYFLERPGLNNGYAEPLTDAEMKQQSSFGGWDFASDSNGTEDFWKMCLDGYEYPRLTWQFNSPADFLIPGRVDNYDLFVLTHDWLKTNSRCCDITSDGIVNLLDYLEFSKH